MYATLHAEVESTASVAKESPPLALLLFVDCRRLPRDSQWN
jgi:hypothetical protein